MADQIRRILGHLFDTRVDLPAVDLLTVTRVELSSDLKNASVYLSFLNPRPNAEAVIKKIFGRKKELRYRMGSQLQIKYVPQLKFFVDKELEQSARIHAIIEDLHHETSDD